MLNKQQIETIQYFIRLHNNEVSQHLRDIGLLNNNGSFSKHDEHRSITDWFYTAVDDFEINEEDNELSGELSRNETASGNPVLVDIDLEEFPELDYRQGIDE